VLSKEFNKVNKRSNRLVVFAPDHGAHLDPETGKGSHGLDIYEDMVIRSFWGIYPSQY
jgi:hypothetical protein